MRAMSPDSWDATRALELTITPPLRICPIGNSQVFQPNTTSCNGHSTFLVFPPLFHSFHSCFYILMVDFVSLLNSIGLYIIQIRCLQTCENWCFGPFSVLRQKIRLIFVDTALHQSSCQNCGLTEFQHTPRCPIQPLWGPQCGNATIRTICIETALVLYQCDGGFSGVILYILILNF